MLQQGKTIKSVAAQLLWIQYIHAIWMERDKHIFYWKKKLEGELTCSIIDIVKVKLSLLPRLDHRLRGSQVAINLGLNCI